jgi:hypothetical protein
VATKGDIGKAATAVALRTTSVGRVTAANGIVFRAVTASRVSATINV